MLLERIEKDLKEALKSRDSMKVSTLRFLKSAIQNAAIEKREPLKDEEVITVIKKQVNQHKDSIEGFKKGNRQDLADKEQKELEILKSYMPEELPQEQLLAVVREAIEESGATSMKDMGKVMKIAMGKLAGRADGKAVNALAAKEFAKIDKEAPEGAKKKEAND